MNESLNGWAQRNAFGAVVVLVIRGICIVFGVLLMVLSVPIGILTPFIPIGLPMGLLGLILVAAASKTAVCVLFISKTLSKLKTVLLP